MPSIRSPSVYCGIEVAGLHYRIGVIGGSSESCHSMNIENVRPGVDRPSSALAPPVDDAADISLLEISNRFIANILLLVALFADIPNVYLVIY